MKCGATGVEIDISQWESWPRLRKTTSDRMQAACPCGGGRDRMRIFLTDRTGEPGVWCQYCNITEFFNKDPGQVRHVRHKWELRDGLTDQEMAQHYHNDLGDKGEFFLQRGISQQVVDIAKLGYKSEWKRLSVPCFLGGKLYGIQLRILPDYEQKCKDAGKEYDKYLSEPGGTNDLPFGIDLLPKGCPYVILDEAPLDALLFISLGFPAISPFFGNNRSVSWRPEWNKYISGIPEVIVVAQNDHMGGLIAASKLDHLKRGRCITAPTGAKDLGEWLKKFENKQAEMTRLTGLPPVLKWP